MRAQNVANYNLRFACSNASILSAHNPSMPMPSKSIRYLVVSEIEVVILYLSIVVGIERSLQFDRCGLRPTCSLPRYAALDRRLLLPHTNAGSIDSQRECRATWPTRHVPAERMNCPITAALSMSVHANKSLPFQLLRARGRIGRRHPGPVQAQRPSQSTGIELVRRQ
jgi:hypothetical protein